ncbi:MAG: alpha/beta hydrolase [Treponema sp.]|jgi:pimeloyl-ACP methyl ester carboxylesterase|nr:alpha/beta hydrolase [Treponema sp.]
MAAFEPWPALASFAKTDGAGVFYYDVPPRSGDKEEAPLLLLIHGLGDEADSWRRLIPPLCAAGYRVLAPDLPGFGRSAGKGSRLRRHALAVLSLLEGASKKPAVLAGSSMGAVVAELAVLLKPGAADSMILIDGCMPLGAALSPSLLCMALPFIGKKWYRSYRNRPQAAWESLYPYYADLEALPEEDRAFLKKRVMDRVRSPSQERAYFASLRSMISACLFGAASFERALRNWPGRIGLIWGEQDRVMRRTQAENLMGIRRDAELSIIPGAGHLPHQDKPEETAAAILRFRPPR